MLTTNTIFAGNGLADPHALVENGKLYVICGHDESPFTKDTWRMDKWVILESDNLKDFKKIGEILPTDTYIGDEPNCWAGNLKKHNNKYYWFFSNKNYSTGVLVADKPNGPYIDVLKKPLIDSEILNAVPPYDPAVIYDGGKHYIIVGVKHYYIATLADNLLTLKTKPKMINIYDEEGREVETDDKPSIFKRNGTYYLVWGGKYAISQKLEGPYKYLGAYNPGCSEHNDFFVWEDEWYMVSEFPETSHFYRGVELVKIEFNNDGTIKKPKTHNLCEKTWDFSISQWGFHLDGTNGGGSVTWLEGECLQIETTKHKCRVQSSIWPGLILDGAKKINITVKNESSLNCLELVIEHDDIDTPNWFKNSERIIENEHTIKVDIKKNSTEYIAYELPVNFKNKRLKRFSICTGGASDGRMCESGALMIRHIAIE